MEIFYRPGVLYKVDNSYSIVETFDAKSDQEFFISRGTQVKMIHTLFGETILENVTEVHFNYPSVLKGKRVAIESTIDTTGATYELSEIVSLWFTI